MKSTVFTTAMLIFLGACAPQPSVQLSTAEVAALKTTWEGKRWEGRWGTGTCTGAVEVQSVSGTSGTVLYEWGVCSEGGEPGSSTKATVSFSPSQMKLRFPSDTRAEYELQADGSLQGDWTSERQNASATGTFTLVSQSNSADPAPVHTMAFRFEGDGGSAGELTVFADGTARYTDRYCGGRTVTGGQISGNAITFPKSPYASCDDDGTYFAAIRVAGYDAATGRFEKLHFDWIGDKTIPYTALPLD